MRHSAWLLLWGCTGTPDTPTTEPTYQLVWEDTFDGPEIDRASWNFEVGDGCPGLCGWGNEELQWYTDREENARIEDGALVIEAREEEKGSRAYTSARLVSKGLQVFRYGRIDVRAQLPRGQGLWPAVWMLGQNIDRAGWPHCGEIDIMEMVGGAEQTVHGTVHFFDDFSHQYIGHGYTLDESTFADDFHTFSVAWTDDEIRWLVDDDEYHQVDITGDERSEFHQPFFFVLNVAVGGVWPGSPDETTVFPQTMRVDEIRVFQAE